MPPLPRLADVRQAAERIQGRVHATPTVLHRGTSQRIGARVWLKCESLQKTGSFKARGALNALSSAASADLTAGVVTVSAGNHAQAVAWAAAAVGTASTVVMPEGADPSKIEACRTYGGAVELAPDARQAFDRARELERHRGMVFVHPFDDPAVLAGQGTVGLEILEAVPDAATVVVPVGGGGLIGGIATAVGELRPGCRVVAVEPEGAATLRLSLERGRPSGIDRLDTIADGLAAPFTGDLAFRIARERVDSVVTVSDPELLAAMAWLFERAKLVVEPAGAAAVAALMGGRLGPVSGDIVAVLSGGNVAIPRLVALLGAW